MTYRPSQKTLDKYGLSLREYRAILKRQNGKCPVCGNIPKDGKFRIDHEHVKGWKAMPDKERKKYVRGLVCWICNHYYLGRGITIERAENVVSYLKDYEERRTK